MKNLAQKNFIRQFIGRLLFRSVFVASLGISFITSPALARSSCELSLVENFAPQTLLLIKRANEMFAEVNRNASRKQPTEGSFKVTQSSEKNWQAVFRHGYFLLQKIEREHFGRPVRKRRTTLNLKSIRHRVKKQLRPFLKNIERTGKVVVISFDGIDTAGKGVNIKELRRILKEIQREDGNLAGVKVKTIKLSKPEFKDMPIREYLQRWVNKFPKEKAIVLLDRSYYNRTYVEEALGFTSPERVAEFRREISAVEREIESDGVEFHKLFFSISLEHVVFSLMRRVMSEQRQHLISDVDGKAVKQWNSYVDSIQQTFELLRESHSMGYFVNNSYFFKKGFDTTDSRLASGLMAMSAVVLHSRLSESSSGSGAGYRAGRSRDSEEVVKVLSSQVSGGPDKAFGNEKKYSERTLEKIDKVFWSLRSLVEEAKRAGLLTVDPKYREQDRIDLGVAGEAGGH